MHMTFKETEKRFREHPMNGVEKMDFDTLAERIVFHKGLRAYYKVRILQVYFRFPGGFTYKQLQNTFNVSNRTAHRWREMMEDIGLVKKDKRYRYAKYEFNHDWQ